MISKQLARFKWWFGAAVLLIIALWFGAPAIWPPVRYSVSAVGEVTEEAPAAPVPVAPVVTHLPTPTPVKGLYMSSWVAGTPSLRENLFKLIDQTELNSVVIDVKDSTGRVAFPMENSLVKASGSVEERISDLPALIADLHKRNIYVIARIAVFQDPYLVAKHPEWAVTKKSDGKIWKEYKGQTWLDPAATPVWDYVVAIAREAYAQGFDELNFDYIRFPADGPMKDAGFPYFDQTGLTKAEALKQFFVYLDDHFHDLPVPISADLFGLTTSATDDLGIGQVLENGLASFDYIAPMVYPSHYPTNFLGYKNPATKPYEVIKSEMEAAVKRAQAANQPVSKLRPWLQDFNLGATYTAEMIRLEKKAVVDASLDSWLMWSAANRYTAGALDK